MEYRSPIGEPLPFGCALRRGVADDYPNQGASPDGVPVYTTPAESIHGEDLVIWYTTGFTHLAKPEDYRLS